MVPIHQFGGKWTEKKLDRFRKYLDAYLHIFKHNLKARWFQTMYVDAFAGTGKRDFPNITDDLSMPNFLEEADVQDFQKGSARIALERTLAFDQYLFIEQNPTYAQQLEQLREQFPDRASRITIQQGDANNVLQQWCYSTNWDNHRAVVFLDPYGMQVAWATIETIARTEAIDLWLLFPLGQGVNRLLTRHAIPHKAWEERLTQTFGTEEWKNAFYQPSLQNSMFEDTVQIEKTATLTSIQNFFLDRLKSIFAQVAENPLSLYNSRNVPIYLLYFAAGNPKGAKTAVKIAQDILKR